MNPIIYIRHLQPFDAEGQPVIYTGPDPAHLILRPGTVPLPHWEDLTASIPGAHSLHLRFTTRPDAEKDTSLVLEGPACRLYADWCLHHAAASFNRLELKIGDGHGSFYEGYTLSATSLVHYSPSANRAEVTLHPPHEAYYCLHRTLIAHNHKGWFQPQPDGGKQHPRFAYCTEPASPGHLAASWALLGVLTPLVATIYPLLYGMAGTINVLAALLRSLFPGGGSVVNPLPPPPVAPLLSRLLHAFHTSAGCGREHPGVLIRDYISNVCERCGLEVDAASVPLFFSPTIGMETASGTYDGINPYYNACIVVAPKQPGIPAENASDFYVPENALRWTGVELLDHLRQPFNADWRIHQNRLFFHRKDLLTPPGYLFDFSAHSPDRELLAGDIHFEHSHHNPGTLKGIYSPDPRDSCGNAVDEGMKGLNEERALTPGRRRSVFGAARFVTDGTGVDFINTTVQKATALLPGAAASFRSAWEEISTRNAHSLLLETDSFLRPKIIIWDGRHYTNAKPVVSVRALTTINPAYNPAHESWEAQYPSRMENETEPLLLANFPMRLAPGFAGTLWDFFHWVDDPAARPHLPLKWTAKLKTDPHTLSRLGIQNRSENNALLRKIRLPFPYHQDGVVQEIAVTYGPGSHISITGNL